MMDMENIEDIRIGIRLLLKAQQLHQVRSLTASSILDVIMKLSPSERASLTQAKLAPEIAQIRHEAEFAISQHSAQLEQVLSTDKNFLPALQAYASVALRS